jgi:hypothetical protein
VSEEAKIVDITIIVLNLMKQNVHQDFIGPLRVMALNVNGIGRQCYVLRKRMQNLLIDVAMLSDTHLKLHERFFIPNYHFYQTDCYPGRNGITVVAVIKSNPDNRVNLPPLVSVEEVGLRIYWQ